MTKYCYTVVPGERHAKGYPNQADARTMTAAVDPSTIATIVNSERLPPAFNITPDAQQ